MRDVRRNGIGRVRFAPALAIGALAAIASLWWVTGAMAEEITRTFNPTGEEQTFVVPAGVGLIDVRARGGEGGGGSLSAEVTGSLSVSGGQTLYIEVAGNGATPKGGFNGGGEGGAEAQGGGGASDIRTSPRADGLSPDTRLLVAAGGGGGGFGSRSWPGGAAGVEGESGFNAVAGGAGTASKGGEAGEAFECSFFKLVEGNRIVAEEGRLGAGGLGESCTDKEARAGGGGGGGGYYGGGGGGAYYFYECGCNHPSEGAGGGGGSSLAPPGGTVALAGASAQAVVELSYLSSGSPPTVVTEAASEVTFAGARLNATVNPNGGEISECELEYGPTTSYGTKASCSPSPGSGFSPVAVSAAVSGLMGNSTYHFRVVATNAGGTSYGGDESLQTEPDPPTVVTKNASEVTLTGARLNATVNPNGGEVTECNFEYGTSTAYGSSAPCVPAPGSGTSAVAVSATVSGLPEGTVYHFRIAARNAGGTSHGLDSSFATSTTLSPPEFGECGRSVAKSYSNSVCTKALAGGNYEWFQDDGFFQLVHPGFTTAIKPATKLLLEVKGGQKIDCTGQTGAGEYSGRKSLANVTLKLTGCYLNTPTDACENAATSGEVLSTTLAGTLGIVKQGTEASKDLVGFRLAPASGESIAAFSCESTSVSVRGSVIIQGKANAMVMTATLMAAQAKGVQKYTHFVGGSANEDIVEVKIGAGAYTQAGLALITTQANQEKVEANTVA
jgi:hypothetical protein